MQKNAQHGAALIIVLFVVALAATVAVEMSSRLMVVVKKSNNLQDNQQAKWYGYAAEALAKQALRESRTQDKEKIHLAQPWAQAEATYPVDGGTISGTITDLHACLNLNALRAKKPANQNVIKTNAAHKALINLFEKIDDLPLEESEKSLADSVYDWVDEDSVTHDEGAEEDEYLSKVIPYLTANHFLASTSELRVIKGFNPIVMEKILPYVCVIPDSEIYEFNVNTIKAENAILLAAVLDAEESDVQAVLSARPEEGWDDINAFLNDAKTNGLDNIKNNDKKLVVNSEHFQLVSNTTFADSRFRMTSLLHISDKNKVTILARKFGGVQ